MADKLWCAVMAMCACINIVVILLSDNIIERFCYVLLLIYFISAITVKLFEYNVRREVTREGR